MSTLNPPKPITKRQELREDAVITTYAKAWAFLDQNRALVYGAIAAVVLVILGIIGWGYLQGQKADEAQSELGLALRLYEAGDYQVALDGTESAPGLLEVADEYGSTAPGNIAKFYVADSYFRMGNYDEALTWFDAFDAGANIVGASALAGEAAIYEGRGEFSRAGDLFRRAATLYESEQTSPQYLLDAGRAYEAGGAYDEALEVYEQIKDDYPDASLASGMDFYIARTKAKQNAS